jgi:chemotaxis protein methyltransferase CheR
MSAEQSNDRLLHPGEISLNAAEFARISRMVLEIAGIRINDGKEEMVKARLAKRLRALHLASFTEYLDYLAYDATGREVSQMIDVLTTNKTNFFREPEHFAFLHQLVLHGIKDRTITIWSAGCASGEEPYSVAIQLHESLPDAWAWDIKILATDISSKMVGMAKAATYSGDTLSGFPGHIVRKYFVRTGSMVNPAYQVRAAIKDLVHVVRLNLMDDWPMQGRFDVIFCRNVMIYFSKAVQQQLIARFWEQLCAGGYLVVGHSESLSSLSHQYRYIQPAIWAKP